MQLLLFKAPGEKKRRRKQEVTVSVAVTKETSIDAALAKFHKNWKHFQIK